MRIRIDPLDKLFSAYVRKRAVERAGGCERCGHPYTWMKLQCCHFHGRVKRSVRWDEDNAIGLCFGCHQYLDSHPLEKVEFFQQKLDGVFDLLNVRAREKGMPDKKMLTLYYQSKLRDKS